MRSFLTGASGFIGGHLLQALLERGDSVRCLVRPSSVGPDLERSGIELVPGELSDDGTLKEAARGCEQVFHCAADYRLFVRRADEMYETNVEGTRRVMRAAYEAGVERVVYTSSVGALGLTGDGTPADENTPVGLSDMLGHYKRSKFLAERVADEWAAKGLPVVIVNPSTPVGEGDRKPTATGRMILDFVRGQVPAYVDTGLNLIDVRDVALGHLLAADKGTVGERYILGHRNMSLIEIYRLLAELCGRTPPSLRLPQWVPLAVGAVSTSWARLSGGEPRVALEAVRLSRYRMFFNAGKAVRELGLPQSPVEDALKRAVHWFRDNGYAQL